MVTKGRVEGALSGRMPYVLVQFLKILLFNDKESIEGWYKELRGELRWVLCIRVKPDRSVPKPKMVERVFARMFESEEEAEARIKGLMWDCYGDEGVGIYEGFYLNGALDCGAILKKWKGFVGFINSKFAKDETDTSMEELKGAIEG